MTSNIFWCQNEPANSLTHLLPFVSLFPHALSIPRLADFPFLASYPLFLYLYLFSLPTSSLTLSAPFLLTYPLFLCLPPPLSLARLLIPPLHPNLNSLKPSIRLHNKLLPLQARQGSSIPVAFCRCVSAGVCVCVCVLCLLAALLVRFHASVCACSVQGKRV